MATAFNTVVELMGGVPLDPEYKHTLTFNSISDQRNYFTSKTLISGYYSRMSYQRYSGGVIKVQAPATLIGTANYLRFNNEPVSTAGPHENKDFYAFIKNIDYISDTVVAITYQIDVLQTWMFDYTLNPCYVEREHANSDNLGDNLVPENLETGDYVNMFTEAIDYWDSSSPSAILNNSYYIVIATQSPQGYQSTVRMAGVPTALYAEYANTVQGLQQILENYTAGVTGDISPIIAILMGPLWYTEIDGEDVILGNYNSYVWKIFTLKRDWDVGVGPFTGRNPITGQLKTYNPKNKKLLTYPYNFITFEAPDGSSTMLKYENFSDISNHITFEGRMSCFPNVETTMAPRYYEFQLQGSATPFGYPANFQHALFCNAYPTVGAASDAFSAWWAQNKYSMPIIESAIKGINEAKRRYAENPATAGSTRLPVEVTGAMLGMGEYLKTDTGLLRAIGTGSKVVPSSIDDFGESIRGIGDIANTIADQLASYKGHQAVPDTVATKASNTGITHAAKLDCYKVHYTKIRPEFAEIIDNYFSCFGYATHVVKVPNVTGRRNWNYVQTVGCTISGNVPSDAEEKITAIYDRGVTFWHNPANIHNYNANNDII